MTDPCDTVRVMAPHGPMPFWLRTVDERMRSIGRPEIRAIWIAERDEWQAIEGSHRLAAAFARDIGVKIVEVRPEHEVCHDFATIPSPVPAEDVLAEILSWQETVPYVFAYEHVSIESAVLEYLHP